MFELVLILVVLAALCVLNVLSLRAEWELRGRVAELEARVGASRREVE